MGNKASSDSSMSGFLTQQQREENQYEHSYPPLGPRLASPLPTPSGPSSTPPVLPRVAEHPPLPRVVDHPPLPRGLERRSMTVGQRDRSHDKEQRGSPSVRRLSTSDATLSAMDSSQEDDLQTHVQDSVPRAGDEGVGLASTIIVTFDRDVKVTNINKLFELKLQCDFESVDPAVKPVKGECKYDNKTQKAEFIPHSTLYPNAEYTIQLMGRAVTTSQCSFSTNIKNAQFTFKTCDPPPKNIGIRMKGHKGEAEKIQIANYYDLLNSLVVWSTRQWGCSGEHVTGLFVEREERGRLVPLKADQDVLRLKENEVVVVEIKD